MLPPWLILAFAGLVLVYGAFRVSIAFRPQREGENRRGFYAYSPRRNMIYGIIFIALAVILALPVFGVRLPFLPGK